MTAVPMQRVINVGDPLIRVIQVAYAARINVLIEGPTGIGKSEIVAQAANEMGIGRITLDLSLLEPSDLIGLPRIVNGKTTYAVPSFLPDEGKGILILEEPNRAAVPVRNAVLQLLSGRRLNKYELPPGWVVVAPANPDDPDYDVDRLDAALRGRFMVLIVKPDRGAWIKWATARGVHPAIISLVARHDAAFDEVPPRRWTLLSAALSALSPADLEDDEFARDVLSGFLPPAWSSALQEEMKDRAAAGGIDVRELVCTLDEDPALRAEMGRLVASGRTDVLDAVARGVAGIVGTLELDPLVAGRRFRLQAFESLLTFLPGDLVEDLQEKLAGNPTAGRLLPWTAGDILSSYATLDLRGDMHRWGRDRALRHRAGIIVTMVRAHLRSLVDLVPIRRDGTQRANLGCLLIDLDGSHREALRADLEALGITPLLDRRGCARRG